MLMRRYLQFTIGETYSALINGLSWLIFMATAFPENRYNVSQLFSQPSVTADKQDGTFDSEKTDTAAYPTHPAQTISQYLADQGVDELNKFYCVLLNKFKTWLDENAQSLTGAERLFDTFFDKLTADEAEDDLRQIAFGRGRLELEAILKLLSDNRIPITVRISECVSVASALTGCPEQLCAKLETSRTNLKTAGDRILSVIQDARLEKAREIALEMLKDIGHEHSCAVDHAVNDLINFAAEKLPHFDLPAIKPEEDYPYGEALQKDITEDFKAIFKDKLEFHLAADSVFPHLVRRGLNLFKKALSDSNIHLEHDYDQEFLTDEIIERIKENTKPVQPLIQGFGIYFGNIIKKTPGSQGTLYSISQKNLRAFVAEIMLKNMKSVRISPESVEKQWVLCRLETLGFIYKSYAADSAETLLLRHGLHFCLDGDVILPFTTKALELRHLQGFTRPLCIPRQFYNLYREAIANTTEISELRNFCLTRFASLNTEMRECVTPALVEQIREQIKIKLSAETKPSLTPDPIPLDSAFSPALTVVWIEYNYFICDSTQVLNKFRDMKHLKHASPDFLKAAFSVKQLEKLALSAVDHDHDDALKALLATGQVSDIMTSRYCYTQGLFPSLLKLNLLQLCVYDKKDRCLKALLTPFKDKLEQSCYSGWTCAALHLAVIKKNYSAIGLLVYAGADINAQSKKGYTPLHWAITESDRKAVVKLVNAALENKQPINLLIKDNQGKTVTELDQTSPRLALNLGEYNKPGAELYK